MNQKNIREIEILVIGAGPAGLGAAVEAAGLGARVLIADDQSHPGGQLVKQIHKFFGSREHRAGTRGVSIGRDLLAEAEACGVEIMLSTRVVGIEKDLTVSLVHQDKTLFLCRPSRIILATGGTEKPLGFPGSTLPGVMTAGAAQTLCNIDRVLPGEEVVMIGSGNVGLIVAYQLLQAGAGIQAVIEADTGIRGYEVHAAKLRRAGVPIITGATVKQAFGKDVLEGVEVVSVDDRWQPRAGTELTLRADAVCIAVGLSPNTKLAQMCGCRMVWDPSKGGFYPAGDDSLETSRAGVYAAGDLTGIEEASIALDEGRLAGINAAFSLGYETPEAREKLPLCRKRLGGLRAGLMETEEPSKSGDVDVRKIPGYPSKASFAGRKLAVLECGQKIPCDPCTAVCPFGAIVIPGDITGLPELLSGKCTGCGLCVSACPGLAIFLLETDYSETRSALSFPFEFLPLPEKGEEADGVDREGNVITPVEVLSVDLKKRNDHTAVVTVLMDKGHIHEVRSIRLRR